MTRTSGARCPDTQNLGTAPGKLSAGELGFQTGPRAGAGRGGSQPSFTAVPEALTISMLFPTVS
jgi:hypothetical protein